MDPKPKLSYSKKTNVWVWECPHCSKQVVATSKNQVEWNGNMHLIKCRKQKERDVQAHHDEEFAAGVL